MKQLYLNILLLLLVANPLLLLAKNNSETSTFVDAVVLDTSHVAMDNGVDVLPNSVNGKIILPPPCTFTLTPDLPLIASSAIIETEINTVVKNFSDSFLGTVKPTRTQLINAEASYQALNINVSGGTITGNSIPNFSAASFLKVFALQLKFNPGDENIKTKANNTVWWVSQQFCSGSLSLDSQMYAYQNFARPASLLQDFLDPNVKNLFAYTLYQHSVGFEHFWAPTYSAAYQTANGAINTDLIYNISDVMLAYTLWQDTPDEQYRYMRAFKRYIDRFFTLTVGTNDGIKADGTGFHHWTAYNNYMYSYNTAASLLSYLSGSSFQVERSNYEVFRNAFYTQYMQANDDGVQALSTAGRNPQSRTSTLSKSALKTLAIAGGDILGLTTADPIFAGLYNRIYGVDAAFNYSTVTPFEDGFFQFNHASANAFRKDGWVAFNKGFTNNMWGAELYPPQNRYGRYQSYGALEVIYPGNKVSGNGYDVDTWDWNYNPGATVIRLPWSKLHGERARIDEMQQKRFVGALNLKNKASALLTNNHGAYGMFAMDFKEQTGQGFSTSFSSENHNSSFEFKKSNFYFDDIIVCLGSGISNNDASNATITTLYQRLDNKGSNPNVNGANQSSIGEVAFAGNSDHWVLSNYNTGFYLLSGNHSLKVKKESQQTPNQNQVWPVNYSSNPTAIYYTGYIDHGTNPSNKSYEYILKPNSTVTEMQNLQTEVEGGNKPYTVHQQDASAHIVEHKAKDVWGYAFFNAASNVSFDKVKGVNASCLVMTEYNTTAKTLLVSVVEPDLGFNSRSYAPSKAVKKQITLKGVWDLIQTYPGVSIISASDTETVLEFNLVDGLSKEVALEKVSFVNPYYPIVYYEDFLSETGRGFSKVVQASGGQALSEIMRRVSDIPDMADSNGQFNPETDRPDNRIPNGDLRDSRAIATVGNNSTTNFPMDAYSVFTTLDLTDTNPLINAEDIYKYASFWTERRYGNGDIATITILVSTAYTGNPNTTTWTALPLISGKIAETTDGLNYVNGIVDLTSYANGANGSTVTLAYRYQGSASAHSATNRNGTFYFSDLKFFVQTASLSVEDIVFIKDEVLVYPNPASQVLNIEILNPNIQVKNVQLIDVSGKIIYRNSNTKAIQVGDFSKGLYFLRLETTTGFVITKKIIIN